MSKVLVIEDRPDVAELIEVVLEEEGFDVAVAYDGKSGLEKFREDRPDLVLLDLILPDIHGFDVFQQMQAIDAEVPIVMLTGQARLSDRRTGIELGAEEYLVKPFASDELVKKVRAILDRQDK
ncbi:MAG: response regulator [Armatimonadetes bacterium]|nr:response regulator [Armatimonadota bacterium]